MNTPPTAGVAGVRPSCPFAPDWQVIDRRDGQVIAVKYEPTSLDDLAIDPPLSALGAAEALAGELNAWAMGLEARGEPVSAGQLCEKARRLRIEEPEVSGMSDATAAMLAKADLIRRGIIQPGPEAADMRRTDGLGGDERPSS